MMLTPLAALPTTETPEQLAGSAVANDGHRALLLAADVSAGAVSLQVIRRYAGKWRTHPVGPLDFDSGAGSGTPTSALRWERLAVDTVPSHYAVVKSGGGTCSQVYLEPCEMP